MNKRRRKPTHVPVKPGSPPATLVAPEGVTGDTRLSIIAYDGDIREVTVASVSEAKAALSDCRVLWLDVDGVGDIGIIEELGREFGFHPLALEDAVNRNQRAKVEDYDDYYYIAVHAPQLVGRDLVAEQLSVFLGRNYVVTVHHRMDDQMAAVRDILRKRRTRITEFGSDFLAYSILDSVIDQYFPVLESFGELTDETEDRMLLKPDRNTVRYVHGLKRELIVLRRAIWPFRDALVSLMRSDETNLISEETMPYFRDLYDHTVRIIDLVETYREVASDLMDVYLSSISNRTNDVMKRLTAITTIIMPLTLITGIYGMNFDNMPEIRHPYGYFVIVAVMILIAMLLFAYFWRQGWITVESDEND
ncbi:MAG: magnesium/cobalt transporter CorA [Fimbriimonadales bacterium]